MKTYKKQMRAVALEVGDLHFKLGKEEYPWYDEDDFPEDMEEIVEGDCPFGGWYKYKVEERYVPSVCHYFVRNDYVFSECRDYSIASAFSFFNEFCEWKCCPYCGRKIEQESEAETR